MPGTEITHLSSNATSLRPDIVQIAQEQLHEKPEWRDRDIQALRDMVLADTDLKVITDDAFLLRFLRARKFDYDRALQLLQQYYLIRLNNPELFVNFRPSAVMNVFEDQVQTMMPERDQLGRRIFIFRAGKWNPANYSPDDIFRANLMCLEHVVKEEETQINGIVAIVDLKDFGMTQAKQVRPGYARKVISLIQDCFPARFKGFHFVNEPTIFDMVFMIIKPFFTEKLKSRLHFHGSNMECLHEYITEEALPEELGGKQPPFDNTQFIKSLLACEEQFADSVQYGYQQKPQDNVKKMDVIEGVVGNYYRKICVD